MLFSINEYQREIIVVANDSNTKSQRIKPKEKFNFFHDERVRGILYQILTVVIIGCFFWYLISNTAHNLELRGMNSGFGFLNVAAGFDPGFKLISYTPGIGTYGRIFLIGILNTLYVSFLAIIACTVLGFFIGILRLSNNWLISKVALTFIEIFRNTPLLIQLIFWYVGVFSILPQIKNSLDLSAGAEVVLLNNRGLYTAWPVPGEQFWITGLAFMVALICVYLLKKWANKHQDKTGKRVAVLLPSLAILLILPGFVFLLTGSPLSWDIPKIEGFNFVGGASLPPAFIALLVALVVYGAAHMAEIVRAGIQSINKGQNDAALAIGLRQNKALRLIIIPQAMPAIIPPMISLWLSTVKNSSLAVAIGYSDIVSLFMQTSLNQAGYAIEIVAMTMGFYMFVSLIISGLLNIYNKKVQLVER
ncbi:ABC transporter permease subunit [Cocleimonas sp. KMM 6892]|uniref:amino acid ABC transporter permease n=1 Tax=unclassified Cocleimonas TaxID=2639732 RepID=UPI002DBB3E19|nr:MULTISPECIES: ABC transporter permease subunit [unclassified Cocleimonas]MEB8434427.1 ABC transporter permease subunit [Cocleimonas sp. KMM 6892]MEC4717320.1 ABC transporter permease subunit [Cocleimonas sp. KMM 6895]MEC4746699.1 ABC transporter permease subunit [Cocleimonas sp. KMM 6896]